jgi:hypothetical protein
LVDSKNVLVEGLTFKNSPMWTITPLACENVTISKITIQNPPDSPNTDGINPDSCRNVHISDCLVDVGDDCITIKSGKEDDGRATLMACENIRSPTAPLHGHGGIVFGSEMSGSVRNVTISNWRPRRHGSRPAVQIPPQARRSCRRHPRDESRHGRRALPHRDQPVLWPRAWGDKKITDTSPCPVDDATPRFRRLRL